MPQITIDDDSAKKNRLRHKRREERRQKLNNKKSKKPITTDIQQGAAFVNGFEDSAAKEKALKKKKKRKKLITLGIIFLIVILLFKPFKNALQSSRSEMVLGENELIMIDLIGYDEQDAIDKLKVANITAQVIYVYDAYSSNGTVIKTEVEAGEIVTRGMTMKIYVCDDGNPYENVDYSEVRTPQTPFVKNHLDVIAFDIVEDKYEITLQNNNNVCIVELTYTVSYKNMKGEGVGSRTYTEPNLQLLPGEKLVLSEKINNTEVDYIDIESLKVITIAVPEEDRIN